MAKEKVLIISPEKCTGCRLCELVCSLTWSEEHDCNPRKAFIRIIRNTDMNVNIPVLLMGCRFCNKCVQSCLGEAIKFVDLKEAALIAKGARIGTFPAPVMKGPVI